ncbi:hypothetical protein [Arthrobacter rhombi]|uniref:hypothetical protein n=1 Tax=Arthrobacter rhombi TaxID=71253 RepID=UPI0031E48AA8
MPLAKHLTAAFYFFPVQGRGRPLIIRGVLPEGWRGPAARRAFTGAHRLMIAPLAEQHARKVIDGGST